MSASVLVGYATRYGSTQEVAEAVAATLRERGLEVDIQPMREVRTLERYRAIVLGCRSTCSTGTRTRSISWRVTGKPSRSGQWPFSRLAQFMLRRRNFRRGVSSSIKNWRNFPG